MYVCVSLFIPIRTEPWLRGRSCAAFAFADPRSVREPSLARIAFFSESRPGHRQARIGRRKQYIYIYIYIYMCTRPVHLLRVFLLRVLEPNFPGDSL